MRHRFRGFTLIELAVALVIMSLLLTMMLTPLSARQEARHRLETQRTLEGLGEALIGFALVYGRLPCPAISADNGLEDRASSTGPCNKYSGFVPWVSLGMGGDDGWGRRIRYAAGSAWTDAAITLALGNPASTDPPGSRRRITLLTRKADSALLQLSNKDDVPAVLVSPGLNGCSATQVDHAGLSTLPECAGADERVNALIDPLSKGKSDWNLIGPYDQPGRIFIVRDPGSDPTGGYFDDLVSWVSPFVLFNRMVAAGKLP
jgi:prepilin-type N-terminal cleavage/methylation domain-containing protein